jgi:hypothetical protein
MLKIFAPFVVVAALGACAQNPSTQETSRFDGSPLTFHNDAVVTREVSEQTKALEASARQIVRASTGKGAALGAAVGCGVGLISSGNVAGCAKSATTSAVIGAVRGHVAGKKDVSRRVEIASPNALVRNIRHANAQLDQIETTLPALLASQDAELDALAIALAGGTISQKKHDARKAQIAADRAALAHALTLSASQSQLAEQNLRTAAEQGQTGLDWHISATSQLARESISARSSISLL